MSAVWPAPLARAPLVCGSDTLGAKSWGDVCQLPNPSAALAARHERLLQQMVAHPALEDIQAPRVEMSERRARRVLGRAIAKDR